MIDQFGRKRCKKKREDVSAVENSFSTYVCYAPDGLFWLNLQSKFLKSIHNATFDSKIVKIGRFTEAKMRLYKWSCVQMLKRALLELGQIQKV